MNKEIFIARKKDINEETSALNTVMRNLRNEYISKCSPCKVGDIIEVVTDGGRKIVGEAKSFAIYLDDIFVDCIKPEGSTNVYLSKPHKSIRKL
jgi:hypothetical protein